MKSLQRKTAITTRTDSLLLTAMGCIESTPEQAGLWDRYEFRANIGDGASSTVFMGAKQNTVPEQLFAIKVMSKAHADAANWIFVFMQEVSMLKLLKHPNIVTFVESFETSNEYVLISEYLSGGQLFGRVGEFDVYNEQIASKLSKQMVQSVLYCHKHNVVHRDIKPGNFVFSSTQPDATLKLIDFGMSQLVQPGWAYKGRIGTLYFMSPEVYDRHFPHHITDDVLKAADVWSLGVTIFMMVTGAEPFAESDGKVIYELAWPPEVDLSDSCKDLISSMLHLDYTKRLTAEQVLAHPWIDKCEHNAVKSLSSVVNALSDFSVSKLMKKVVIGLLNKEDKPEDVQMLQELFHELDIDGDHRLDVGELTGYMMQHGFTIRDEANMSAKELIDSTEDSKSKQSIDFDQFHAYHLSGRLGPEAVAIRKVFDTFDTANRGYIELIEIKSVLSDTAAKTLTELIKQVDKNTDGRVTFATFLNALTADNLKLSANYAQGRLRGFMTLSTRNTHLSAHSIHSVRSSRSMTRSASRLSALQTPGSPINSMTGDVISERYRTPTGTGRHPFGVSTLSTSSTKIPKTDSKKELLSEFSNVMENKS